MIQVHKIGKQYLDANAEPYWAIRDVNFSVGPGEILGLLGPNGAGKTTLLRILSTVLVPTQGHASVCGFDVAQTPEAVRRQIGFVSANTAVYDRMTGWEFVRYFGQLYEIADEELDHRMAKLFRQFEMDSLKDTFCGKMSTGMKQKISIARALIHNPDVLIFDEATLGLDILASRNVLKMVAGLRDEGKCILFSSHIMREVERLCDRVAILYGGSIVASGSKEELIERFAEPDLEEVFFRLISPSPERPTASQPNALNCTSPGESDVAPMSGANI